MISQFETGAPISKTHCTFRLEGVQAASVALVGDFNGWSTTSHLMKRVDGRWEVNLSLPPGRYSYYFFAIEKGDIPRGFVLRMGSTIDVEPALTPGSAAQSSYPQCDDALPRALLAAEEFAP